MSGIDDHRPTPGHEEPQAATTDADTSHRTDILVVDDTPANLKLLSGVLRGQGYKVRAVPSGAMALKAAISTPPDLLLLDIKMPDIDGYQVCEQLKANERTRKVPILFISALHDTLDKVRAFSVGGVDYITKPFQMEEVLMRVKTQINLQDLRRRLERANEDLEERVRERTKEVERLRRQLEIENAYLREEVKEARAFGEILGESSGIREVREKISQVAPTDAPVLILGESGTGKELVARAIHAQSRRKERALISVNCASIPKELFESEFFGHVKGAFTGAIKDRAGRFAAADGGTLFLDEIGEIPITLQGKLLRVLQEGMYERLGEETTRTTNVRIIAATNRDLRKAVTDREFREDLYYRVNVFPLHVPPLRARKGDIAILAQHFLKTPRHGMRDRSLPLNESQLAALSRYDWPGNVRELQNVIERAVITSRDGVLRIDLDDAGSSSSTPRSQAPPPLLSMEELRQLERKNILNALERSGWKIAGSGGAAELLGIKPTTLLSKMKSMEIQRPDP